MIDAYPAAKASYESFLKSFGVSKASA